MPGEPSAIELLAVAIALLAAVATAAAAAFAFRSSSAASRAANAASRAVELQHRPFLQIPVGAQTTISDVQLEERIDRGRSAFGGVMVKASNRGLGPALDVVQVWEGGALQVSDILEPGSMKSFPAPMLAKDTSLPGRRGATWAASGGSARGIIGYSDLTERHWVSQVEVDLVPMTGTTEPPFRDFMTSTRVQELDEADLSEELLARLNRS